MGRGSWKNQHTWRLESSPYMSRQRYGLMRSSESSLEPSGTSIPNSGEFACARFSWCCTDFSLSTYCSIAAELGEGYKSAMIDDEAGVDGQDDEMDEVLVDDGGYIVV